MYGYRHEFHAGNAADVVKHTTLVTLAMALQRKTGGYCYLDTHAGSGLYSLTAPAAQKCHEFRQGIGRLWTNAGSPPPEISAYLDLVRSFNPDGALRQYPGSPALMHALARAQDRLILCEGSAPIQARLHRLFQNDRRVATHHQDGYLALKAFLPPPEHRALVLIDPAYETVEEYHRVVATGLTTAIQRWPATVVLLWYPLMEPARVRGLQRAIRHTGIPDIIAGELLTGPEGQAGYRLQGCGLCVVNPPWGFEERFGVWLAWLAGRLAESPGGGSARVTRMSP